LTRLFCLTPMTRDPDDPQAGKAFAEAVIRALIESTMLVSFIICLLDQRLKQEGNIKISKPDTRPTQGSDVTLRSAK
jgi:hypothetical protein